MSNLDDLLKEVEEQNKKAEEALKLAKETQKKTNRGLLAWLIIIAIIVGGFVWMIWDGYTNHTPNKSLEVRSEYDKQQDEKSEIEQKTEFVDNLNKEGTLENQWYEKYKDEKGYPKN